MAKKFIQGTELVQAGFANGISTQLAAKQLKDGPEARLTDIEKSTIIANASKAFANFLTALGVDYESDPNSAETPMRVAKAYVNDLWAGRYSPLDRITAFPSDGYDGIVQETVAIHNAVEKICEGNQGVAVMINATHACVSCRGVKHQGAAMQTAKLTGAFLHEDSAKAEFYKNIELSARC